jgi:ATP-dependent helicase/DNAse subunit B
MIYDARTSGLNSGDVSRYALQLKHLYAPESLNQSEYSFTIKTSKPIDITIEKDDAIIEELRKYCDENSKNRFSASSLEPYCQCPIKFFYQSVMHIKAENEPTDYMDPITRGDIIHNVMLDLYIPDKAEQRHILTKPNHLDKTYLSNIIANDQDRLEQLIRKHINISYLNKQIKDANSALTGDALLTAKMLQKHIIKIIEHDIRYAPITLYGGEIKGITRIQLQCGETVNFTYAIDRLDRIETSEGDTLRIVDYKSGNSHIEAASIDDVFNGNYKSQHIFQLMLYANLYSAQTAKSKIWVKDKPIRCEIYSIPDISKSEKAQLPEIAKETITNHLLINEQFIAKLEDMMAEIFNPQIPFKQTNCKANCVLCNYKSICRR